MMENLKPCPFCGGEAEMCHGSIYISKVVKARCTKCRVSTDFVFINHPSINIRTGKVDETTRYTEQQAEEKAAAAWNRRYCDA